MLVMCQASCHSCPGDPGVLSLSGDMATDKFCDPGALQEQMYEHLEKKISTARVAPQHLGSSNSEQIKFGRSFFYCISITDPQWDPQCILLFANFVFSSNVNC